MVRRDDWVKGAHFRLRLVRTPGVAAGQDWSKGSAELSIRARALSLKYRSECTGVRLFCLVIIYHAPRAQACNLGETPFECFAECLTFASSNLADYRHRYIGAGPRADDAGRVVVQRLEFNSAIKTAARDIYFVLACPWITPYPAALNRGGISPFF
jgi:hypothetical protein